MDDPALVPGDLTAHGFFAKPNHQTPRRLLVKEQTSLKTRPHDSCRKRKNRWVLNHGASKCVVCEFHDQNFTIEDSLIAKAQVCTSGNTLGVLKKSSVKESHRRASQYILSLGGPDPPIDDYANLTGPSLLKKSLGLQHRPHGRYLGYSSECEPALTLLKQPDDTKVGSSIALIRHVTDRGSFTLLPNEGSTDYEEEIDDLDAIEALVYPHGEALINVYFRIVYLSFPILLKKNPSGKA